MISIRDIVISRARVLPSLYINVEEIHSLFTGRLVYEKVKIGDSIYVRYPILFGSESPLAKVWFDQKIVTEISNDFLYVLESKLRQPIDNFDGLDEAIAPSDWEILIKRATLPINLVPAHLRDTAHPTAVRCG